MLLFHRCIFFLFLLKWPDGKVHIQNNFILKYNRFIEIGIFKSENTISTFDEKKYYRLQICTLLKHT